MTPFGRPVDNVVNACATGATAVRTAIMAVRAGEADVGLAVGVEQMGRMGGAGKSRDTNLMPGVFAEMISRPNTLPMCCPTGDGAAAAVLVSDAKLGTLDPDVRRRADKVSASVLTSNPWTGSDQVQPDVTLARMAVDAAYEQAGVGPEDLDLVELHDCFAGAELLHYHNLRLCEPGAPVPSSTRARHGATGGCR